jgi:hypothetical protein
MPQADVPSPHQPQMVLGFQLDVNHLFRLVAPRQVILKFIPCIIVWQEVLCSIWVGVCSLLVEPGGFEPPTSAVQRRRSPS